MSLRGAGRDRCRPLWGCVPGLGTGLADMGLHPSLSHWEANRMCTYLPETLGRGVACPSPPLSAPLRTPPASPLQERPEGPGHGTC